MKFGPRLVSRVGGVLTLLWGFAAGAQAQAINAGNILEATVLEATVPVAAQSADELKRAAAVGLADVLVGVSGRAEVVQQPAVRAALTSADGYVEQYRYERQPAPENTLVLKMKFAQATVDGLLRSAAPIPAGAGAAGARPTLILTASGIESFSDYAQLLTALGRIVGVRAALPQAIAGDVVSVQLRFDGAPEQLTRQLALEHRLQPEAAPLEASAAASTPAPLRFHWQGS